MKVLWLKNLKPVNEFLNNQVVHSPHFSKIPPFNFRGTLIFGMNRLKEEDNLDKLIFNSFIEYLKQIIALVLTKFNNGNNIDNHELKNEIA